MAAPVLRKGARRISAAAAPTVSKFDVSEARASLSNSLRSLQRACIDVLLLHDCTPSDLANGDLLEFLCDARARGQIRCFGIATDVATILYGLQHFPEYSSVIQFANNLTERNLEQHPSFAAGRACITHTPFGGWRKSISAQPRDAFRYALAANPSGIVLFSTQNEHHITQNVHSSFDASSA